MLGGKKVTNSLTTQNILFTSLKPRLFGNVDEGGSTVSDSVNQLLSPEYLDADLRLFLKTGCRLKHQDFISEKCTKGNPISIYILFIVLSVWEQQDLYYYPLWIQIVHTHLDTRNADFCNFNHLHIPLINFPTRCVSAFLPQVT